MDYKLGVNEQIWDEIKITIFVYLFQLKLKTD